MKKFLSVLLIVAVLLVTMTACGIDRKPAIDALNQVAVNYNAIAVAFNEAPDEFDEEAAAFLNELGEVVVSRQKFITEGEVTEEDIAEAIEWSETINERLEAIIETYDIEE